MRTDCEALLSTSSEDYMKKFIHSIVYVFAVFAILSPNRASATLTYGDVYVDLGTGDTVLSFSATGGPVGVQVSVDQGLIAHSEATSFAGGVGVVSLARGSGTAQSNSKAIWNDSFAITAAGYTFGNRGTFSAGVEVQGGLRAEFSGRTYADAYIVANFGLDTGVDNGHLSANSGGRRSSGYDSGTTASGQERFLLYFDNVPFLFGQDINTSLTLRTVASNIGANQGGFAYASAEYGHTMTWVGIANLRDASGQLLTNYSAVSADSGFNFANATPVPELPNGILLALGLMVFRLRLLRTSRH